MKQFERALVTLAGICLLCVFGTVVFMQIEASRAEADDATSKQTGTVIIHAIERYRAEHAGLPPDLEALVPAYLDTIPRGARNDHFLYSSFHDISTGDSYSLCFPGLPRKNWGSTYGCCYDTMFSSAPWHCFD